MQKKVRVALIGAGFIAHYHAKALLALENVEIAAICDKSIERA
ncbi:MAG: gfo/Idh/MocA family oxidoreductase, partial [Calditrichaeota bacterium]